MTARIIDFVAYRAAHPGDSLRVRVTFDPLWAWRLWLAMWGIR